MEETFKILEHLRFTNSWWIMIVPLAIILLDIITGITNAWVKGEIKSYRLREGLGKKAGEIVLLILGWLLYQGLGVSKAVPCICSLYISFMEFISNMENLKKLGVQIPKFIDRALSGANEAIQNGEISTDKINKAVDTLDKKE